MANKNRERRWVSPNTRAKQYAAELKNKVHMHGPKEGQPLTDMMLNLW